MNKENKLETEDWAQLIVDYFFQECGARISMKDYIYVKEILKKINNAKPIKK